MKKIYFLYHIKERELQIINFIEEYIYRRYGKCIIKKGEFYNKISDVILFNPDIIVTIPLRDEYSANYINVVKILTNAAIVVMTTEGYYKDNDRIVNMMLGHNRYSDKLIDEYIVWGPKTKERFGNLLLNTNRISDLSRIKVTGYSLYEKERMFRLDNKFEKLDEIRLKHKYYKKNVLVLTGFLYASTTLQDLLGEDLFGGKKENELGDEELSYGKALIDTSNKCRNNYINKIVKCAEMNKEWGFIIKTHPTEISRNENYFDFLEKYENITLIKEAIPIGHVLPMVDVMIHYNSTSNMEAYIYQVPTILIADYDWVLMTPSYDEVKEESTVMIDIDTDITDLSNIINTINYKTLPNTEKKLYNLFNWKENKEYRPVEWNAKVIMECKSRQRLNIFDRQVRKAVLSREGKYVLDMLLALCLEYPGMYLKTVIYFVYRLLCERFV